MFKRTFLLTFSIAVFQVAASDSVDALAAPAAAAGGTLIQGPPSLSEIEGHFSDFGSYACNAVSHACESVGYTFWSLSALGKGFCGVAHNVAHFVYTRPATTAVLALAIVGGGSYLYVKYDRSKRRRGQ